MGRLFKILILLLLILMLVSILFGKKRQQQLRAWVRILAISLVISGSLSVIWKWIRWF